MTKCSTMLFGLLLASPLLPPPVLAHELATVPVTVPATTQAASAAPSTRPTPEAAAVMEKVEKAYGSLKSLKLIGTMAADLDVAGKKQSRSIDIAADFLAPALYRHRVKNEVEAGSTSKTAYVFELKRNVYIAQDAPATRVPLKQLPETVSQLLDVQNPGLLLAISVNSIGDLMSGAKSITREPDMVADGKSLPTLAYTASDGRAISLAFDPSTWLLKRAVYDLSALMRNRGAEQVNKAVVTIDYSLVQPGATYDANYFQWSAPPNARELLADQTDDGPYELLGKPAPDFTLNTLDGKTVKLSDLKGQVVLLDFWATWCPPCIQWLPTVGEIANERKIGVKSFAIDVGESAATVQAFVKNHKVTVDILLDPRHQVADEYGVTALPTTLIIKPDGTIYKAFMGIAHGGKAEILRELDAAGK